MRDPAAPANPRRRSRALALTGAALLALAACRDDGRDRPDPTTASPTTEVGEDPTTTLPDGADQVVLRGDGLGVVAFGDDPDDAVEAMTSALGEPTADPGWTPAFSEYGTCPGEQIRAVSWDHLTLLFTDGETAHGAGEHLFSWRVDGAPPALGTETGFGWGATTADAEELHPGQVDQVPAEEPFPGFLVLDSGAGPITAFVDDEDVVTHLEAGAPCGE